MLFNSNAFYLFLPIVFAVYWLTPRRYRWGVLLVSSYYFYMSAGVQYVPLLFLTNAGLLWHGSFFWTGTQEKRKKNFCLGAALVFCLGILYRL